MSALALHSIFLLTVLVKYNVLNLKKLNRWIV